MGRSEAVAALRDAASIGVAERCLLELLDRDGRAWKRAGYQINWGRVPRLLRWRRELVDAVRGNVMRCVHDRTGREERIGVLEARLREAQRSANGARRTVREQIEVLGWGWRRFVAVRASLAAYEARLRQPGVGGSASPRTRVARQLFTHGEGVSGG